MIAVLRRAALLAAVFSCSLAFAQTAAKPEGAKGDAKASGTTEAQVAARFAERAGAKPDQVFRSQGGLFEVLIGGEIFYVDAGVNFVITGRMFDSRTREDLTQKRLDVALKVDVKALPFDRAIKVVRGDGSRVVVTFEDPNCPYCKRLWQNMQSMTNVTIYTFLYPILSAESVEKSKAIWCAKDRAVAWEEYMVQAKAPAPAPADCKTPIDQNLELGKGFGINGTPTMIFTDGSRGAGAMPAATLEQRLASAAKK